MKLLKFKDFVSLLNENENPLKYSKSIELFCGGGYGHLEHPFEDINLTFSDLQEMINITVNGAFGPENFVQEKCLSGDTLVQLKDRGLITISEVVNSKLKDQILSFNESNNSIEWANILNWVKNENSKDWILIETENSSIKVTSNHRIFVINKGDVKAENIKINDILFTINGNESVKFISKINDNNECFDLTVSDFGRYFANNILVHNTDGQNLMISWKNNKLIAARNKSHLRNFGENALDSNTIAELFSGRGEIEEAFNKAMEDLSSSISTLSKSDRLRIFNEGQKFASVEVITPITQNTVPYGINLLVFHGVVELDENGNAINEDKESGRELGRLIQKANSAVQKTFFVRGPQDLELKPFPNTKARESYYNEKLKRIMNNSSCDFSSTISDYAFGMASSLIKRELKNLNIEANQNSIDGLARRVAEIDKSYTISQIKKDLKESADKYIELEKKLAKKWKKEVYAPLESIFIEIGTEMMRNMSSFLSANPTKASEEMRKEIESVISKIKNSGDEKDIEKMEEELLRLSSIGGIQDIVPTEGITFVFKGKLYKYTGMFMVLHQLRSILAYKK